MKVLIWIIFFTMLGMIGFQEGWKSAIKFFGIYFLSAFLFSFISRLVNSSIAVSSILSLIFFGGYTIFLWFYCFLKGYIRHI